MKHCRYIYRGKDCFERFCKDLKELGMEKLTLNKKK